MWFAIEVEKCIQIQKNFHGWSAKKANRAARNLTKVGKGLDTKSQSLIISAQKSIVIPQQ
jgi:hypothetical protein